ncbi:hypothetical protein [Ensifer sp. Root142]|uniref:hypothetical protein n=1 Tax=Ensifer sp. Root142 TaxID=1736461 RepID=UPI000AE4247E|nr:hypothetical protein [Ensifer sp. Root142]
MDRSTAISYPRYREDPVPTLTKGDIVTLDNLGSHKGQTASRAAGADLFFLPP